MGLIKGILLVVWMLLFGGIALMVSLPAMLTRQRWKFLNQVFLKPFGWAARKTVGIKLIYINEERIRSRRPAILLGNHQSGFDLATMGTICTPATVVVVKKEFLHIPLLGWYFRAAGNLFLDRQDPASAKAALAKVAEEIKKHQLNVAIFPEGTRSRGKNAGLLPFKKGGFYLARAVGAPVIPVVGSSMQGRSIWESLQLKGGNHYMSVLEPVETQDWTDDNMTAKVEEIRVKMENEFHRISALAAAQELG